MLYEITLKNFPKKYYFSKFNSSASISFLRSATDK